MSYLYVVIRSVISAVVLFLLTKWMGQKQISQLNMFDYTVGITIGSIAADMAINTQENDWIFVIAMAVYAAIAVFVSVITIKSLKARSVLSGKPLLLIEDGQWLRENMMLAKLDIDDVLQEARIAGYFDVGEINYAILESNGHLSFLPKQPIIKQTESQQLNFNVVVDGQYVEENLKALNKSTRWLSNKLKKQGYTDLKAVYLATLNQKNELSVYSTKEKSKVKFFE